jgi:outer membrane protein OmpU
MKKILLTTTALTMLAGAAAADISLSGSGRIGIVSKAGVSSVTHRFRINANASGETDGGLTFGAYVRMNMNGGQVGAIGAPRLYIGNGMATLTVGNAGGAISQAGNIWGCGIGFRGDCDDMAAGGNSFNWVSHSSGGAGASVVRLDFALGSANISISGGSASGGATNNTEIAANFQMGTASVGIGYDSGDGAAGGTLLNVSADAGSVTIGGQFAMSNGTTGYMGTIKTAMGAGSLYAGFGNQLNSGATATQAAYFVSYKQPLGGGANASVSVRSVAGVVTTDAGITFGF